MSMQYSFDEYIRKAKSVHADENNKPKYDYSEVKYTQQNDGYWKIKCLKHNVNFEQYFQKHLKGQAGCEKCATEKRMNNIKSKFPAKQKEFIKKAKAIHVNKSGRPLYDYSRVNFTGTHNKVDIICNKTQNGIKHGVFPMEPANHTHSTNAQGCPKCSKRHVRTRSEFIREAQILHSNDKGKPLYDYSKIAYVDMAKHVSIYCKKHNHQFKQTPSKHLAGQKCPQCASEIVAQKNSLGTERFIKKAKEVHGDRYDYSLVDYKSNTTKVIIICEHHGPFLQSPSVHVNAKSGCQSCRFSGGEQIIQDYLRKNKIKYESQFRFDNCRYKNPLPFDFKVEWRGKTVLIEYQGDLHFKPVSYSKTDILSNTRFEDVKKRDKIKKQFAKTNNYDIIYVDGRKNNTTATVFSFLKNELERIK